MSTIKLPQDRVNRIKPVRGEWQPTAGSGWQHGDIPAPPTGLLKESRETWATWMCSWWAFHWTPDDLPGLAIVVRLYDQVRRGDYSRTSELRQMMDNYGITPKGQQDRRWLPPKPAEVSAPTAGSPDDVGPYAGLRVVSG